MAAESSRLGKIDFLAAFFFRLLREAPADLLPAAYLSLARLAPAFRGIETNVGDQLILKALAGGGPATSVAKLWKSTVGSAKGGETPQRRFSDLGELAAHCTLKQKSLGFSSPRPLTLSGVYNGILRLATAPSGAKATTFRVAEMVKMLARCGKDPEEQEACFLVRILIGKTRTGASQSSVLAALGAAAVDYRKFFDADGQPLVTRDGGEKWSPVAEARWVATPERKEAVTAATELIKQVYSLRPILDDLVTHLVESHCDLDALPSVMRLTAGVPIGPMLAHPTKGLEEALRRIQGDDTTETGVSGPAASDSAPAAPLTFFTCEYKYDGERCQVHRVGRQKTGVSRLSIFSRNHEDYAVRFPELPQHIDAAILPRLREDDPAGPACLEKYGAVAKTFVLDCEVVAYDVDLQRLRPFQKLARRPRKEPTPADIDANPVALFCFDLLFLNGQDLLHLDFVHRRALLHSFFQQVPGKFFFANGRDFLVLPGTDLPSTGAVPDSPFAVASFASTSRASDDSSTDADEDSASVTAELSDPDADAAADNVAPALRQALNTESADDDSVSPAAPGAILTELSESSESATAILDEADAAVSVLSGPAAAPTCSVAAPIDSAAQAAVAARLAHLLPLGYSAPDALPVPVVHDAIMAYLHESVSAACEGLMIKQLAGPGSRYTPARRSHKWLKVKKDYLDSSFGDTFDVVPVGGFFGEGKRRNWIASFLCAVYNEDSGMLETLCKVGTGLSETQFAKWTTAFLGDDLSKRRVEAPPDVAVSQKFASEAGQKNAPIWFDPAVRVIWEIKGADLQRSSDHTAAGDDDEAGRGIGLRFPRFLRHRTDKVSHDEDVASGATTSDRVLDAFHSQAVQQ
jgi:ATP-dependent DNA ligase